MRASGCMLACIVSVMPLKMLVLYIFCHDNGGLCSAHTIFMSESQFCVHVHTCLGLRAFGCVLACNVSVMPLQMLILSIFCHDNGGLCSAHTAFMYESQFSACTWMLHSAHTVMLVGLQQHAHLAHVFPPRSASCLLPRGSNSASCRFTGWVVERDRRPSIRTESDEEKSREGDFESVSRVYNC